MRSLSREALLQPSLSDAAMAKAPYTVRTTFLAAFFGGPIAAIAITAINAVRLRRWSRDLLPLGLAVAAILAFTLALHGTEWGADFRARENARTDQLGIATLFHWIGLACFGLGTLLHRKEQRGADLMGLRRPNGLIAGLACIAAAAACVALIFG